MRALITQKEEDGMRLVRAHNAAEPLERIPDSPPHPCGIDRLSAHGHLEENPVDSAHVDKLVGAGRALHDEQIQDCDRPRRLCEQQREEGAA